MTTYLETPPPLVDTSPLLVLWDLDHTLLDAGPVSGEVYRDALLEVTGREPVRLPDMTGRTEADIMRRVLAAVGVEITADLLATMADTLVRRFTGARDDLRRRGTALPGASAALDALALLPHVHQGVLTGNLPGIARVKLAAFGLDDRLDLACGGYGDDDTNRAALVPVARRRATARTGVDYPPQRVVLVGDTPRDVAAALASGIRVLAVATGICGVQELFEAGATVVLPDLTDTSAVVAAVLGQPLPGHAAG
jgi:phosphoglycolate phosphatase-like HAD superfamily hydrolase